MLQQNLTAAYLPSEDVHVVDESGGEPLDGALGELGELLAQQQRCLRVVHVRARRRRPERQSSKWKELLPIQIPGNQLG